MKKGAPPPTESFTTAAAAAVRTAVRLAGGREVCFVCTVGEGGVIETARVVARGDVQSVLALPGFAARGEMLLHNHPSGLLEPSGPDLAIAAKMHDGGIGFAITNNEASDCYVVVEVPHERATVALDVAGVDRTLGPEGLVAAVLPAFEDRPSQRAYASRISRLYNSGGVGLLEAGTGVGKSLGYLVPALRWAAANGERTIVSTNTINLQEQLVGKDLPFLARALTDQNVRFALLKGWHNYVCLARLDQAVGAGATLFDDGHAAELEALVEWAERTTDGSTADLPQRPRQEVWDEVAAESDLCPRLKCAHFDKCFLFKARRHAAQADVIVVNHHLLLSDLAVRRASQNWEEAAVLPAFTRIVIDEGHHLEDAAASHLGATVSARGMQRLFGRLERRGKGLLPTLALRLGSRKDLMSVASLDLVHGRLMPSVAAAREKATTTFSLLDGMMLEQGAVVRRLQQEFDDHPVWTGGLKASLEDLIRELELMRDSLILIRERMESDEEVLELNTPILSELRGVTRRLDLSGDALRQSLTPGEASDNDLVRWLEVRGKDRNIVATAVPLDLAPILREDLFKRVKTAIVTSATLSTEGRFDFVKGRLGLDDPELEPAYGSFASPFDYAVQALLAIPVDIPAPNINGEMHFQAVIEAIRELCMASGGGVFGLFTSHRDVRAAAAQLREGGALSDGPLLVHGEDSRDQLLQRFRQSRNSVLLGTSSFWEGVDVPGDALRGLVINKLPFRVPTEPLTAAHCELIDARGGDAFQEYMLPHAALRLKQGFGRLIRTADDRGVVLLMDSRAANKRYGEDLVEGLPPAKRVIAPWAEVRSAIRRFYR